MKKLTKEELLQDILDSLEWLTVNENKTDPKDFYIKYVKTKIDTVGQITTYLEWHPGRAFLTWLKDQRLSPAVKANFMVYFKERIFRVCDSFDMYDAGYNRLVCDRCHPAAVVKEVKVALG